jgi:hypothetical protein
MVLSSNSLTVRNSLPFTLSNANFIFAKCNVGIGTSTPSTRLDVSGVVRGNNIISTNAISIGTSNLFPLTSNVITANLTGGTFFGNATNILYLFKAINTDVDVNSNQDIGGIVLRNYNTVGSAPYQFPERQLYGIGFVVRNGTSSNQEAMTIDNTGRVGLGLSNPTARFDVNGSVLCRSNLTTSTLNASNLTVASSLTASNANFSNLIVASNLTASNIIASNITTPILRTSNLSASNIVLRNALAGNPNGHNHGALEWYGFNRGAGNASARISSGSLGWDDSGFLSFFTSPGADDGFERIRITEGGDVGIGLTNPAARLEVNGNVVCRSNLTTSNLNASNVNEGGISLTTKYTLSNTMSNYALLSQANSTSNTASWGSNTAQWSSNNFANYALATDDKYWSFSSGRVLTNSNVAVSNLRIGANIPSTNLFGIRHINGGADIGIGFSPTGQIFTRVAGGQGLEVQTPTSTIFRAHDNSGIFTRREVFNSCNVWNFAMTYNSNTVLNYRSVINSNSVFNYGSNFISSNNILEFGWGWGSKEDSAGTIGYGRFGDCNCLDVVGAGTAFGNRRVKVWDILNINSGRIEGSNNAPLMVGNFGYGNEFVGIGHASRSNATNTYAILQQDDGTTYINTGAGTIMRFRSGNVDRMTLYDNDLEVKGQIDANNYFVLANSIGGILLKTGTSNNFYWRIRHNYTGSGETNGLGNMDFIRCLNGTETTLAFIEDDLTFTAQLNFTGTHRVKADAINPNADVGLIVVANGEYSSLLPNLATTHKDNITINEALPMVELATKRKDARVFGVVGGNDPLTDDGKRRKFATGAFVSCVQKENGDDRILINALGEGAVWVCETNGNFKNGDYITTSTLDGYGEKQDEVYVCNYTLGKITCDVEWRDPKLDEKFKTRTIKGKKCAFVGCVYVCG